jgi:hypothetical protein
VDRGGEPHAGLEVKGVVDRMVQGAHNTRIACDIERVREVQILGGPMSNRSTGHNRQSRAIQRTGATASRLRLGDRPW